jgi:hypothetical protein
MGNCHDNCATAAVILLNIGNNNVQPPHQRLAAFFITKQHTPTGLGQITFFA